MKIHQEDIGHLQEDELVQLLDREAEAPFLSAWDEHVAGCHPCAERLAELEHASGWMREHAPTLDAGVEVDELARARALAAARSAARRSTPAWRTGLARAAAIAGILAIAGVSVEPLRAWVLENAGRVAARFDTEAPAVSVAPPPAGAMVSFQANSELFVVEVEQLQAAGSLTIDFAERESASAQVVGGANESLSVLPSALLIGNTPTSQANYSIGLPTGVRRVQVMVGGEILLDRSVTTAAEPIDVSLAPAGARD